MQSGENYNDSPYFERVFFRHDHRVAGLKERDCKQPIICPFDVHKQRQINPVIHEHGFGVPKPTGNKGKVHPGKQLLDRLAGVGDLVAVVSVDSHPDQLATESGHSGVGNRAFKNRKDAAVS